MNDENEITIGSDDKNSYQILGKYVNAFHAKVYSNHGQFYIEDLNSTFGTYVNNRRIEKRTLLNQKDRISIGYNKIRLSELYDQNESDSVQLKDLIIPGRRIDKSSFIPLLLILISYPIVVAFGVPTILVLFNVSFRRTNLNLELDVWELSPYLYWLLGILGMYIIAITAMNLINGLKNTAGNNGEHP